MPGEGGGFVADPFHQAAVTGDAISVVVDQIVTKAAGHQPFRQGHADRVGQSLTQRAGGGLDTAGVAVFRMSGGAAADLAKVFQLFHRHVGVAGQMQQ